jgi:GNAT superfamily N-acetyltransferase
LGIIAVRAVEGRKGLRTFLRFPERLYREDPLWVAPVRQDQKVLLSPTNPFFSDAAAELFLAFRDGSVVGRVAAIVDNRYVEERKERVGFFGFFESVSDTEVARSLLDSTRAWLRVREMSRLQGPVNPSMNLECGLLVEGFEHPPRILMPYNPPYYCGLLEQAGLHRVKDLLSYDIEVPDKFPDWLDQITQAVERRGSRVRSLNPKAFREEIGLLVRLYNGAWRENWGFVAMTEQEGAFIASRLRPFLVPELALIAESEGVPVGFALSLPDYNPALRLFGGRVTPWGLMRFHFRQRTLDEIRVLAFGILPEKRKQGIDMLLLRASYEAARSHGYRRAELSWILEDNVLMRRFVERLGGRLVKRYRLYEASL